MKRNETKPKYICGQFRGTPCTARRGRCGSAGWPLHWPHRAAKKERRLKKAISLRTPPVQISSTKQTRKCKYHLREFPLNSRHPGPRREEGRLRAAGHMPLCVDPGDPGDPGENAGRLYSMRPRGTLDTFARNWRSNF
jgi:hypothetical protein